MNDTINQVGAGAPANCLREALAGLLAIVDESRGVAGYHLNGAIAEWGEFPEVGAARATLADLPECGCCGQTGACAADYDARQAAPAAPVVQADVQPVAWQARHTDDGVWMPCGQHYHDQIQADPQRFVGIESRPLYAAPPAHPDASVLSILRDARESVRYHKGMQNLGHEAGKQHAAELATLLERIDAALAGKGGE